MNILERTRNSIANTNRDVFLRRDFEDLGSASQVGKALRRLISEGFVVKLGVGVYAKAGVSVLSGKPIPIRVPDVLIPEVLRMLGVDPRPSRLTELYNSGKSKHIPAGMTVSVGKSRVSRKLGFAGRLMAYERS